MQKIARFKPTRTGDPPLHASDRKKKKRESLQRTTSGREEGCERTREYIANTCSQPCKVI